MGIYTTFGHPGRVGNSDMDAMYQAKQIGVVADSPKYRTAAIGDEAVVNPDCRVICQKEGVGFYGRFAQSRMNPLPHHRVVHASCGSPRLKLLLGEGYDFEAHR